MNQSHLLLNLRRLCTMLCILFLFSIPAGAADQVRTAEKTYTGIITDASKTELAVTLRAERNRIPVDTIQSVTFDREPKEVSDAKAAMDSGRYEDATASLNKLDISKLTRKELADEVAYLRAEAMARTALAGTMELSAAIDEVKTLITSRAESFRVLPAMQLLAELQTANGDFDRARQTYDELGRAGLSGYQARAEIGKATVMKSAGDYAGALAAYERILAGQNAGQLQKMPQLPALLGKAECLCNMAKGDEAISLLESLIAQLEVKESLAHAKTYNALGKCYSVLDRPRDAVLAYLHVDVLFFQNPAEHAEALTQLTRLWEELGRKDRAVETRESLVSKYPHSPFVEVR